MLYEKRIHKINTISAMCIILAFIFIMMLPVSNAVDTDKLKKHSYWGHAKEILEGPFDKLNDVFNSDFYKDFILSENFGNGSYTPGSPNAGAKYPYMTSIYNALKIIGGLWVVAIAMARIITNIDKGMDPMECVFKGLIEIGITFMFIMNLDAILSQICQFGQWLIDQARAGGAGAAMSASEDQIIELIEALCGKLDGGWSYTMGANIAFIFPGILAWLTGIVLQFLLYQIIIEIALRKVFAPMAVADIYQEGLRSPGVRYLKKLLASFLKMAICVMIVFIVQAVETHLGGMVSPTDAFSGMKKMGILMVFNFTAIGGMFKAGEIANDIVGA